MKARVPLPLRLARRWMPGPLGAEYTAELAEEYRALLATRGRLRAHLWMWRQLLRPDTLRLVRALRRRCVAVGPHPARTSGVPALMAALRPVARSLLRRPGFSLAIVGTLALGIGANTAVFSVVDGVLLEPLPYPDGDRLAFVWGETARDRTTLLSGPQAGEVLGSGAFVTAAQIFGFGATSMVLEELPEPVRTLTVDHRFFELFGVAPELGRTFRPEDEYKLTNEQIRDPSFERPAGAMVLSHAFWTRRFGASPDVLGRIVRVSGHRQEIVGVMPEGFRAHLPSELGQTVAEDVWIMSPFDQPSFPRDTRFVHVVGRVDDQAGIEGARVALDRLAAWQRTTFAEDGRDEAGMRVTWLHQEVGATARGPLALLLAAVGLTLLIACVNVATLLLMRAVERDQELRLRRALGAGRVDLAWIGLVESAFLAIAGGALGVAMSPLWIDALLGFAPAELPRMDAIAPDVTVLGFTTLVTVTVAILCGALPALRTMRVAGGDAAVRITASSRERWVGGVLVSVEVALAVMLVTGAGLLVRSLGNALSVDPGFEPSDVYAWEVNLTTPTHPTWASRVGYFRDAQEALLSHPGVESVGIVTPAPFDGADRVEVRLGEGEEAARMTVDLRRTGPGALEALGVDLVGGRHLEWADMEDFDALRAVVDERFARLAWPEGDPVGQVLGVVRREYGEGSEIWDEWKRVEVVGVVRPIRGRDVRFEDPPTVYVTYSQNMWGRPAFVARSETTLDAETVRRVAAEADTRPLLTEVYALDDLAGSRLATLRFALTMLGAFGALGLVLSATGVYGVLAYGVRRRERELNIRAALGADGARLSAGVLRLGMSLTGGGVVVGWIGGWWLTRFFSTLLYGVDRSDPITYLLVGAFLLFVAAVASWVPARRTLERDPAAALR